MANLLHQAINVEFYQPVFGTETGNKHQAPLQSRKQDNILNVLPCPSPSQYFVGREDTLRQLVEIFSFPIVSIWSTSLDALGKFVRQKLRHKSLIFLDASSSQALEQSYADMLKDESFLAESLLILENADPLLVLKDHLPDTFSVPMLVTSTDSEIGNRSLHSDYSFHLSESENEMTVNDLVNSIEKCFDPSQHITTLVGNGGSGKTQVVLKFAAIYASSFSNIWFFDATSEATLSADFKKLGKAIGCSGDIESVCKFLGRSYHNWLCIFDNANDKVDLGNYIPRCKHGNVLVTSRLAEVSKLDSPGSRVKFEDLDKENAIKLLLNHAHNETSEKNVSMGSEIVDALGCHAVAVSMAGAYIHANATCTLANYLTQFNQKQKELLNDRRKGLDKRSIYGAFQLSFEQLSHRTQFLLQICVQFHPTSIPIEIFTRAAAFTGEDTEISDLNLQSQGITLMTEFLKLFPEDSIWYDSIDELCKLSLASFKALEKTLSFQTVICTCAHETTTNHEDLSQAAMLLLGRAIPRGETSEEYEFRHNLFLQASHFENAKLPTVYVKNGLAQIFSDNGRWEAARRLQEEVLLLRKEIIGEHHPDTLTSMDNLAFTYQGCGKLDTAEKLQEEVMLCKQKVFGTHHPSTLVSMTNLAATYWKYGKLKAAEKLQEDVLLLSRTVIGEYHPHTLTSMNNLAATYVECGKLEAAEKLQEEVLLMNKRTFGEHHPDTMNAMNNLATTYTECGKLEAAEKLEEEVLLLREEVIEEHHYDRLISMNNLAATYREREKHEAAERLQERTLLLSREVIGEHHPDTLTLMDNLGATYAELGKLEAAERLQEEVILLRKEVSGEHHPDTLSSMNALASMYWGQGKLEAAEKLQEQVLSLRKKIGEERHPDTLTSMNNLASFYWRHGKLEAAEKLEEEALSHRKEIFGEHHPDTLISMNNLAATYAELGKLEAAEKLQEEVLLLSKNVFGEDHYSTLTSMGILASTYRRHEKLECKTYNSLIGLGINQTVFYN